MHNNKRKIISTMLFLSLGFLCLILGSIGIVLPLLPTVPFYLVTVFCFARSSEKLYDWFTHTSMYKKTSGILRSKKRHDTAH
ncbi:MAG: YbaN family protein [Roseburia sp.]